MSEAKQWVLVKREDGSRWCFLIILLVAIGVGPAAECKLTRPKFPYGQTHSCSKIMGLALRMYAYDNDEWFPHGMGTPEASLSLLCKDDPTVKDILRGKHLPQTVIDQALARDGVLGPTSCGWHYVEGLREDDSPQLAVLWDRVTGLNHWGQCSKSLQCEVVMIDGSAQQISATAWPHFVEQQKKLLAETVANRPSNSPPILWSDEETLGPNNFPPPAISKPK